jgi:hypothetical protein
MRTLIVLCLACALAGCSFGGYVADSSSDYNDTLADVANKQLVINILRARDNLPLEFSDLSQIRGSIQGTAALQPTAPFGPLRASTTRTSDGGTLSVQLNPTFDIAPLNTQDFTKGTLTPIDITYVDTFQNQGVPANMLLQLFVSSVEKHVVGPDHVDRVTIYQNIPCFAEVKVAKTCPASNFSDLLSTEIFPATNDYLWLPVIHAYNELTPIGVATASVDPKFLPSSSSGTASAMNSGSLQFVIRPAPITSGKDKGKTGSQIYEVKPNTALCRGKVSNTDTAEKAFLEFDSLTNEDRARCTEAEVIATTAPDPTHPKSGISYKFNMRSVQAVIQYLGQLVAQPKAQRQVSFFITDIRPRDPADIRIDVPYEGKEYFVAQGKPLAPQKLPYSIYDDDTMRILSIVSEMLNVYKNASEIPATKAVQGVP